MLLPGKQQEFTLETITITRQTIRIHSRTITITGKQPEQPFEAITVTGKQPEQPSETITITRETAGTTFRDYYLVVKIGLKEYIYSREGIPVVSLVIVIVSRANSGCFPRNSNSL